MPKKATSEKPVWPFPHVTRMTADVSRNQWVKRIKGNLHSFGVLDDPDAALKKYQREGPDLHAGRVPRIDANPDGMTLAELCGRYLKFKKASLSAGALKPKTYRDYEDTVALMLEMLDPGLRVAEMRPAHFTRVREGLAERFGPTRRGNAVKWIRQVFHWAYETELLEKPVRFGQFKSTSVRERRELENKLEDNLFSNEDVHRILIAAQPSLRAPIWLGLNAGLGNNGCSELRWKHIDLDKAYVSFPRPKTGIKRQFYLWRETVEALREVQASAVKPRSREYADRVFLTEQGYPLQHGNSDALKQRFRRLLVKLEIVAPYGEQEEGDPALGFYTFRRTFRTIADGAGQENAARRIMGHTIPGMTGVYVRRIDLDRLKHVADHVYQQLFRDWTCKIEHEKAPDQ